MKYRLAAALALLAAPTGLAAQDIQITLDQTLVENFDGTAVTDALKPFNAAVTAKAGDNGGQVYDIVFQGGMTARAIPTLCKDTAAHTGCTGLRLISFFDLPPGKTPAEVAEAANVFNATHEATQVIHDGSGKTRLAYYVVSDFGITRTNLVVQIYTFRQSLQAWGQQLFGKPAAPAAPAQSN